MFNYCEIVKGGPSNRGDVVRLPDGVSNCDLDYYGKNANGCYHSAFSHTEDYYHFKNPDGSKMGYDGPVFSNYLYWDMDNDILEKSRVDTIELVERLMVYNKDNIRIYFSGGKGFHVFYVSDHLKEYLKEPKYLSGWNNVIKSVCCTIADDLQSFDRKIYDKTRIIRTPNSQHQKTGLYKIPITYEELCTDVGNIRSLASKQRRLEYQTQEDDDDFKELIINFRDKKAEVKSSGLFTGDELFEGIMNGFADGNCHRGLVSLAGLLHSRDISNDIIYAILTNVNAKSDNHANDAELNRIVEAVGRYPVKKEYVEAKDEDIVDIRQAGETWEKIITQYGYTSFGERFPHINDRMKTCIPGDTTAFVASSGVGKSTMGLELGNEEAKAQNKKSLFGSLEMSRGGVFFRVATVEATELSKDGYVPSSDVVNTLLDPSYGLKERVYKQWSNLLIIDKGGLSLDKMVEYYRRAQDLTKGNISNLVIDYFQNLDNVEKIDVFMETSRRLKDVAKELNTKLFVLLQTNKALPDDYTEPQKNHIEGAGAIFQSMDYIIAAYKSRDYKDRLHAKLLKDRWGSGGYTFDFVREGLKYHTEDYLADSPFTGGL